MDNTFTLIRLHLPSNPEIASALATITLQLLLLFSQDESTEELLTDLDTVVAGVAFSYRAKI